MATYIDPNGYKPKDGGNSFVVGSSEAPRVHGFSGTKAQKYDSAPRFKNQFFVHFQFRPQVIYPAGLESLKGVSYKVITFDAPKFEIQNETMMQYNKRRIIPTQIQFSPCNITWHDSKDAQIQKFWQFIYEFYFKDGKMKMPSKYEMSASTKIIEGIDAGAIQNPLPHTQFGYHLGNKEEYPNLFSAISLYLVANLQYTRIDLVNPYLQAFNHDSLSQEDPNTLMTLTATFQPETVVYVAENQSLDEADNFNGTVRALMGMSDKNTAIFNHYSYDDTIPTPTNIPKNKPTIRESIGMGTNPTDGTLEEKIKRRSKDLSTTSGKLDTMFSPTLTSTAGSDYMQWWHFGDVEAMEVIIKNIGTAMLSTEYNDPFGYERDVAILQKLGISPPIAVDDFSFLTAAVDNLFKGTKPPQHIENLAKALQTAVATSPAIASNPATLGGNAGSVDTLPPFALEKANVDAFDDLNGQLASVTDPGVVPSEKSTDALKTAVQNVQKGAPGTVGQALSNALSYGQSSIAVNVSGARASLLGGTVPSFNAPGLSNIGFGSLLPGSMAGLNQTLQTLSTVASVVNVVAGGNSFGKFSTGASTLANVVQGLSTGNLKQTALAVGSQTHFSPNVGKAITIIDMVKASQSTSQRLVGSNFNNSVVSSSRGAAKPWVNPDSLGNKTVNTTLLTTQGKLAATSFNKTFGPAASTQNKNIHPW
jgi:hypothetical protein